MKSSEKSINTHFDRQVLDAADLPQVINGFVYLRSGGQWVMPHIHCNPALLHIDKGQTEEDGRKAEARGTKDLCHQAANMEETVQVEPPIYMYLARMWVCFCTCMCGQHGVHVC